MKKLLQIAATSHGVLSLEEELMVMQDTEASRQAAVSETEEAERTIDIVEALEDLAFVADTIERVTPREAALIQIVADTAMAGTGVDGAVIAPAMEADVTVQSDRLKVTIQKVVAMIKQVMKSILDHIKNFYEGVQRMGANIEQRLEEASKKLAGLDNNRQAGQINILPLTVGGDAVLKPSEMARAIREYADAVSTYAKDQGAFHFTQCSQMLQFYALVAQGKSQPATLIQLLEKAINASDAPTTLVKSSGENSTIDSDGPAVVVTTESTGAPLVGGVMIHRKSARLKSFDAASQAKPGDIAELVGLAMRSTGFYVQTNRTSPDRADIDTPTVGELKELVSACQGLLGKAANDAGTLKTAADKAHKLAVRANEEIAKRLESITAEDLSALVNVAPRVTKHLTEQGTAAYAELTNNALRVIGQTLAMVSKGIAAHSPAAEKLPAPATAPQLGAA